METTKSGRQDKTVHENVNLFNRLFFWQELVFLTKRYKKTISDECVFGVPLQQKSKYLREKFGKTWTKEVNSNRDFSLWKLLLKMVGLEFLMYNLGYIVLDILRILQPILLQYLLSYFTKKTEISKKQGYIYANLLILVSLLKMLIHHWSLHTVENLGTKIRTALSTLIYMKSLKLSQTDLAKVTRGHVMNLLSNDINKFNKNIVCVPYVYLGPLNVLVVLYLILTLLGPSAAAGIVAYFTIIPLQMFLAKKGANHKSKNAMKADQRIRVMNEIVEGIKLIKLYTWEKPFSHLVEKIRKSEIHQLKLYFNVSIVGKLCYLTIQDVIILLSIVAYVLSGYHLNAQYVYVLTTFYSILQLIMGVYFPLGMSFVSDAVISIKRIETFLKLSEAEETHSETTPHQICMKEVNTNVLSDVTLEIESEGLVAITGPVGSGKTSLLQVILHEIPVTEGSLYVSGRLSYAPQDPWIFGGSIKDNILFGEDLDEEKYRRVVKACALDYDLSVLAHGDETLIGERGAMVSGGQRTRINLARAVYKDADFYLLDDPFSALDVTVAKHVFENCIKHFLKNKSVILVTNQLLFLEEIKTVYFLEKGRIVANGNYHELKKSELLTHQEVGAVEMSSVLKQTNHAKEHQELGSVSSKIYQSYCKHGGICTTFILSILVIFLGITKYGSRYFLSFWINTYQENEKPTYYIYIYSSLVITLILLGVIFCSKSYKFCLRAATNLHDKMLTKTLNMPMIFFDKNPTGHIINRFARDVGQIDENLPEAVINTIVVSSDILGVAIINIIINPWLVIPTVIFFWVFYYFRKIFLSTSRSLKRMEARARSPLFSHLNTTLHGLATVRASKAQNVLLEKFEYLQDLYTSAYYTFLSCDRCFSFWLDLFCVLYLAVTTLGFLIIGKEFHGGSVGLSVYESLYIIGVLQFGIRQWSEMENQMISVERVVEYSDLAPERDNLNKSTPSSWPQEGRIVFQQVSLRYSENNPFILKNLSFQVNPKEKIGIVGRTGAGKSSLVSVFFHLTHFEGDVLIDGVNTKTVPLKELRSKISILPQEPTLFCGTIRSNLDPLEVYQDSELWGVLEDVELKDFVCGLPSGLSSKISERGENLSFAQRQMLSLARIILRKNKILILDEAAANVDPDTDRLIQDKIREKLQDSTVLSIAHKVENVMHCDKILVMDDGYIVEDGSPARVLLNENGIFYRLVNECGKDNTK